MNDRYIVLISYFLGNSEVKHNEILAHLARGLIKEG
jgi:hypothetical protein